MKWTDDIKAGIGRHMLTQKIKNGERSIKLCKPADARNMGILFNATESVSFEIIKDLVKQFTASGAVISVLGYVDGKNVLDNYLYRKGFDFFTKSDLNWYYKPVSSVAEKFMLEPFDLLLNLCLDDPFPVHYITAVSPALFKAGRYIPADRSLDFMIDIEKVRLSLEKEAAQAMTEAGSNIPDPEVKINATSESKSGYLLKFLIDQLIHYLSIINK